jgi:hypothetical protein
MPEISNNLERNRVLPKTPSILILTAPNVDVKGRFGRGELGYLETKSKAQDVKEAMKATKGMLGAKSAKSKVKGMEMEEAEEEQNRVIMSIPISSDFALSQLREQRVPVLTPLEDIKNIASEYSSRYGILITVSSDMGSSRYADVLSVKEAGRVKINLHPILQYRDREYIESEIMQAIQECRDVVRQSAFGWQRG